MDSTLGTSVCHCGCDSRSRCVCSFVLPNISHPCNAKYCAGGLENLFSPFPKWNKQFAVHTQESHQPKTKKKRPKQSFDSFAGASFDLRKRRWIDDASAINFAFKERKSRASVCVEKTNGALSPSAFAYHKYAKILWDASKYHVFDSSRRLCFPCGQKLVRNTAVVEFAAMNVGNGTPRRLEANTLFSVSIVWFVFFCLIRWLNEQHFCLHSNLLAAMRVQQQQHPKKEDQPSWMHFKINNQQ